MSLLALFFWHHNAQNTFLSSAVFMMFEDMSDVVILIGALFGLIAVFVCICVVCDVHLVPAVETVIEEFDVPEEIAAVTLIAFGSSSPEILLNTVSAFQGSGALSMPAILGSSIIAFGLIPPLCILSTSEENVDLETRPILRETICFFVGLCLFTKIVADGTANLVESVLMLCTYCTYVAVIVSTYYYYRKSEHIPHVQIDPDHPADEDIVPLVELSSNGSIVDCENVESKKSDLGGKPLNGEDGAKAFCRWAVEDPCLCLYSNFSRPFEIVFYFAIPALHDGAMCRERPVVVHGSQHADIAHYQYGHSPYCCQAHQVTLFRALSIVGICILYVCVFATLVVSFCTIITRHLGVDQSTIGATIVALGAQLPDIVSSIALARDGYFNGAMANAIGSQVISITLGVGLPALMMCLYSESHTFEIVNRSDTSINFLVALSFVIVSGYCFFSLPLLILFRSCKVQKSTTINRQGAHGLLGLFFVIMSLYIIFNE